jgi:hypothetical protein
MATTFETIAAPLEHFVIPNTSWEYLYAIWCSSTTGHDAVESFLERNYGISEHKTGLLRFLSVYGWNLMKYLQICPDERFSVKVFEMLAEGYEQRVNEYVYNHGPGLNIRRWFDVVSELVIDKVRKGLLTKEVVNRCFVPPCWWSYGPCSKYIRYYDEDYQYYDVHDVRFELIEQMVLLEHTVYDDNRYRVYVYDESIQMDFDDPTIPHIEALSRMTEHSSVDRRVILDIDYTEEEIDPNDLVDLIEDDDE